MNRNYLMTVVRIAAKGLGYNFFSGPDLILAGRVNAFPAVWLSPPKLTECRGKSERRRNYRVNIYFFTTNVASAQQDELWNVLERDAESLAAILERDDRIQRVFNTQCTPNKLPLTKTGEVGMAVEFDVEMFYCI